MTGGEVLTDYTVTAEDVAGTYLGQHLPADLAKQGEYGVDCGWAFVDYGVQHDPTDRKQSVSNPVQGSSRGCRCGHPIDPYGNGNGGHQAGQGCPIGPPFQNGQREQQDHDWECCGDRAQQHCGA